MQFLSRNKKQTEVFARHLAKQLRGGQVLALIGDLGTGKTTLVKGLARALGVKVMVQSPTFVLVKNYPVTRHSNIKQLAHFDCYRLPAKTNWQELCLEQYWQSTNTLTVIEWAERLKEFLPNHTKYLYLHHAAGGARLISDQLSPSTPEIIKQSAKLKTVKYRKSK